MKYSELFPGVTAVVHKVIDELGPDRIRQIEDKDRWAAALSPIGAPLKRQCGAAYRMVGGSVQPLEEDGS